MQGMKETMLALHNSHVVFDSGAVIVVELLMLMEVTVVLRSGNGICLLLNRLGLIAVLI